jgi:uncharacterized protein (TIGR02145 family)
MKKKNIIHSNIQAFFHFSIQSLIKNIMKNLIKTTLLSFSILLSQNLYTQGLTCPFQFEGANCSEYVWTIYIAGATLGSSDMVAGDQIAIFDGGFIVGYIELTQVCTPENQFENALPAHTGIPSIPGYTPGSPFTFKACIDNGQILAEGFTYTMSDPYGGAWTGDVFPPGDGQYSIIELHFECTYIDIEPTSIGTTVPMNGSAQEIIEISGSGCDTLSWNIEVVYTEKGNSVKSTVIRDSWLTVYPLAGNLPPEESELVTLDFNTNNLEEGIYYANIIISSNDVSNPEIIVPVIMNVVLPLQHFSFEGGNPENPVWTIYLSGVTLEDNDLVAGDEIAVFDSDVMVGLFVLDEVCTPDNAFDNDLTAFSTLTTQPGYNPSNAFTFKCWDVSEQIEADFFVYEFFNPYGDAYMGDVFPSGDGQYSVAELNLRTPISYSYNLVEGYHFVSSNLELMDYDMIKILSEILNDNLEFVRNTQGYMLQKIGNTWVNGIGDWIINDGYLFKMSGEDSFAIDGILTNPGTPVPLVEGYQIVSFLPGNQVEADQAFNSILGDNLDFIRNSQGYTLQKIGPNWVNSMGNCISGEGYLIKMLMTDTLIYYSLPPCGEEYIDYRNMETYNTIEIGDQCWLAENMDIGIMINGDNNQTDNGLIEKYCYDNDPENCKVYGGLYKWNEMMQYTTAQSTQGICPDGWHLPSNAEWYEMESYLDPSIGSPFSTGCTGWDGTDCGTQLLEGGSSGFEAKLSGYKDWYSGEFILKGIKTIFNTTTGYNWSNSIFRMLAINNPQVNRKIANKNFGLSVRCLRNDPINTKTKQSEEKTTVNFKIKNGNPNDPVWTIYFDKGDFSIDDEIAVYDGEILAGAGRINSEEILENAIPVFSNLYEAENKPIIKVWIKSKNTEYVLNYYTFSNPYGDAWTENVFPSEDGEYSLLHFSTTGISDENENNDISIYPNPTTGIITIGNLARTGQVWSIEITDITGKIVFQLSINHQQSSIELDLSELKNGVYFINFSGKDFNQVKKIVIQ